MKKLFTIIFLFCILICNPAFAENFYITNYDVKIDVDKNKKAHVVETIDTYFTHSSHGIYRTIPLKGNKVSDLEASEDIAEIEYLSNTMKIKLGNADRLISGAHTYKISYDYIFTDNKNEFYFNIIGTDWTVPINNAHFEVKMPYKFNPDKAGLSIGKYGSAGFDGGALFNIGDTAVSGNTTRVLEAGEGITLRIEVPEGYFAKYENHTARMTLFLILCLTVFSILVWFVHGKDKPVIPVVNFYPPKNLNSAEVEMVYKGHSTVKGIVSLIFYLANKGYLEIEETKSAFTSDFKIKKLKNYDGNNPIENTFFNALLPFESTTLSNLETSQTFYLACKDIIGKINKGKTEIFASDSISGKLVFLMYLYVIGIIALTLYAAADFNFSVIFTLGFPLLFPIIAVFVLVSSIRLGGVFNILFGIVWSFMFGGIPLFTFIIPSLSLQNSNLPVFITGIFCTIISSVCLYHLPRRNDYGNRMLGEVSGLKKFIQVAEKDRLQRLVKENPSYVYDVLPFAYVLGVSDKWIKQFESIMTLNPEWYSGSVFNLHTFNNIAGSMSSASVPSPSNGGTSSSSGGGGHSGGGGGGGGGGSW